MPRRKNRSRGTPPGGGAPPAVQDADAIRRQVLERCSGDLRAQLELLAKGYEPPVPFSDDEDLDVGALSGEDELVQIYAMHLKVPGQHGSILAEPLPGPSQAADDDPTNGSSSSSDAGCTSADPLMPPTSEAVGVQTGVDNQGLETVLSPTRRAVKGEAKPNLVKLTETETSPETSWMGENF